MGDESYSNPLPPPPRAAAAGSEKPLSNNDFRKLLENPALLREKNAERSDGAAAKKKPNKWKPQKKETTQDEGPQYRDRAKERREDANPDYRGAEEATANLQSLHSVAPPGHPNALDPMREAELHRQIIENSKFLGGDVEHTHLVKGLDFALLQKVRGELEKANRELDEQEDAQAKKDKAAAEAEKLTFRTVGARAVHDILMGTAVRTVPVDQMFQPGRCLFVFDLEDLDQDLPTTTLASKADLPRHSDALVAGVDTAVLERLSKIMSYLRMGAAGGKGRKLKKKERAALLLEADAARADLDMVAKAAAGGGDKEAALAALAAGGGGAKAVKIAEARETGDEDDIFGDVGTAYTPAVPKKRDDKAKPAVEAPKKSYFEEDMEEELGDLQGPTMPPHLANRRAAAPPAAPEADLGDLQGPTMPPHLANRHAAAAPTAPAYPPPPGAGVAGPQWTGQYDAYGQPVYMDPALAAYQQYQALAAEAEAGPQEMTQADKDAGLGSVFKRADNDLKKRRETDVRERDPTFVSDTYSECYPGYQSYNMEINSDDEEDLTQMDMGRGTNSRVPHRSDFATEEEWAQHQSTREATPKAAFQFGVKTADGRMKKKNKDQKMNNQLNEINKIIKAKKDGREGGAAGLNLFGNEGGSNKRQKM